MALLHSIRLVGHGRGSRQAVGGISHRRGLAQRLSYRHCPARRGAPLIGRPRDRLPRLHAMGSIGSTPAGSCRPNERPLSVPSCRCGCKPAMPAVAPQRSSMRVPRIGREISRAVVDFCTVVGATLPHACPGGNDALAMEKLSWPIPQAYRNRGPRAPRMAGVEPIGRYTCRIALAGSRFRPFIGDNPVWDQDFSRFRCASDGSARCHSRGRTS
jgi:hypothetical protein